MILTVVLATAVTFGLWKLWTTARKMPPGPFPYPVIGNLPQLARLLVKYKGDIVKAMREISEQYGNVFTLWLGPLPTVHIADYETAHKSMVKEGNNHRLRWQPYVLGNTRGGLGLITSDGQVWQTHRRFALHTLRNFGLGRNIMEERIMQEFHYHCGELEKTMTDNTCEVKMNQLLDLLVGSIINRLLVGYGYHKDNKKEFFALKSDMDDCLNAFNVYDTFLGSWAEYVPGLKQRLATIMKPQLRIIDYLRKQIVDRKEALASGRISLDEGEGEDYLGSYLIAQKKTEEAGDETMFDDRCLAMDLFDLWIAGMETTVITIHWAFHHFMMQPHIIEKCKTEIHKITNQNRTLSLTDRPSTPYLNAVINEVQRHASILNMNLWRRAEENCEVGGHRIEAGTILTAQLSLIMTDEKYFKQTDAFRPERYLDSNGKELEQMTIPFGIGKRSCLGESLARAELYLIIGNLLQRYDFSLLPPSSPHSLPTAEATIGDGIMHRPKPLTLRFTKAH